MIEANRAVFLAFTTPCGRLSRDWWPHTRGTHFHVLIRMRTRGGIHRKFLRREYASRNPDYRSDGWGTRNTVRLGFVSQTR